MFFCKCLQHLPRSVRLSITLSDFGSVSVSEMEVHMVADMEVDKVTDMFKTKCIKPEMF